ncbi:MAG: hypothetical protein WC356_02190 [Candidatus Micrarchaeia archaeon]
MPLNMEYDRHEESYHGTCPKCKKVFSRVKAETVVQDVDESRW